MVLSHSAWSTRAAAHRERLLPYVTPHLERRHSGVRHPVHDFLFTYYAHRPAQLLRWHPGFGVRLENAPEYEGLRGYAEGAVTAAWLARQLPLIRGLRNLLSATAGRSPQLGCFGLHEWAMVYRMEVDGVRHPEWPLRLWGAGTDAVVESHRIQCSHFDAYRFFTPPALPLNTLRPGVGDRADFEQPGCLHGTMDLYKHAFRLSPLIPSELVADCFELAWKVRVLDMRASPYDFADLGLEPVRIETPEGKQAYAAAQREFAERAAPLRAAIIAECDRLLGRQL
ncbi:hypothetical protein Back2_24480 [Nocardioides baekrokdamisoli]|uniref:3-methyladenine DNA glycosylase n=1 Tax=Nocardioides baekrokdamisoli TaxID=1804624 RepID=A0A3G9IWU8_9ACTN|nr:hypothetical protein Back2_24480 [Nocardioides baekrokdamisoli]